MSHYIYKLFINFLLIHYFIYRLVRWSDPPYTPANAASTIFIYSHMGNQIVERLRIELPRYVILMYQIPDILSMNHLVYITKFVLSCKTITFHL